MTQTVVHFSISGDFLTDFFRDLVVEGRWDYSLNALIRDVDGMTHDIAISILSGSKRLTGIQSFEDPEGIQLVDDDAEEYLERLGYAYGHFYEHTDHKCYIPYAIVDRWGREDALWAAEYLNSGSLPCLDRKDLQEFSYKRSLFYADNQFKDLALTVKYGNVDTIVLFKIAEGLPPLWMTKNTTPQESVDNALKFGHFFYRRGWEAEDNEITEEVVSIVALDEERSDSERVERVAAVMKKIHEARIEAARKEIIEQANSLGDRGWMTLSLKDKNGNKTSELRVPRGAFEGWALQIRSRHMMTVPWSVVSSSGWKMYNDDPYHTDWLLGAGLEIETWYDMIGGDRNPIVSSAYDAMHELQRELLGFECTVLAGKGTTIGRVVLPKPGESVPEGSIIVIPSASPDYEIAMLSACKNGKGAVITEVGGKLCHLATVGREFNVKILRLDNATKIYTKFMDVCVDCDKGEVHAML
jgi:phosphohistidine swiveling domain-containing protein